MEKISSPCVQDCPCRSIDCRSICEPFKVYTEAKNREYEVRKQYKSAWDFYFDEQKSVRNYCKKQKH